MDGEIVVVLLAFCWQAAYENSAGRPACHPRFLIKLYVYGYLGRPTELKRLPGALHSPEAALMIS
jgi:hypothetical protein